MAPRLFTCRTEDWHFLKTVLFYFLNHLPNLEAAGDETGLGRQICWEAAKEYSGRFLTENFSSLKHDLGFALMNQLSVASKRFPRCEQDVAGDFFALRKVHTGTGWVFTEGRNTLNPASHCDIAWAGALATHAHTANTQSEMNVLYRSNTAPNNTVDVPRPLSTKIFSLGICQRQGRDETSPRPAGRVRKPLPLSAATASRAVGLKIFTGNT